MTPEGWRRVHLSEVADRRTEKAVPAETDTRPYVALEHLAQGNPALLGWSEASAAGSAKTVFRKGDVLFGKLRPYLRKAAPAPFDGLCSTDILALFSRNALDMRYLTQIAQWHPLQQHAVATSSGTKMPRTSWPQLGVFSFALPPHREQRKIAAILSSLDDAIEKTQAVIDQVQVVKRGLMQELFTRALPSTSGQRSKWTDERLDDLFVLQLGKMLNRKARETSPMFPYLGNREVQWGRFDFTELREMHFDERERKKFRLRLGDLLVCEGGEIGRTALWTAEFECYYQKAIHLLRVRDSAKVEPRFILHFMRFASISGLFTDLKSQSSIAHLTKEKLALLPVSLPPLAEQRKIAAVLSAVDDFIKQSEATMRQSQITKRNLMSVLLTGELRVTPDAEVA